MYFSKIYAKMLLMRKDLHSPVVVW